MFMQSLRLSLLAGLCAGASLFAQEPAVEVSQVDSTEGAAPGVEAVAEISEAEGLEMVGFLTALGGGVVSLQLDEAGAAELAQGLVRSLKGELTVQNLPQAEVEQAFGEAQARAEAVQAGGAELPGFSEGALEKIGVVISLQSGLTQLGFGADEAAAIRSGFVAGSSASELPAGYEAKMPAFQKFIQGRIASAEAAFAAEQAAGQEAALAEFKTIADEWSARDNVHVVLETTQGAVEIELYPKAAPLAVANFVGHIESGYYNGLIFHRVIDGFMVQGGDPLGNGTGGESIWGKPFPDEFTPELRFDQVGLLAMANSGPMTNGSQFFITTSTPNWLNDRHTIFGKVVDGYDNVVKIEKTETGDQHRPVAEQKIVKAYVK